MPMYFLQKLLEKGTSNKEIRDQLNTNNKINVIVNSGNYELDKHEIPKDFEVRLGVSKIYQVEDSYVVLNVKNIIPSSIKELQAVRGLVLGNYQNHLEDKWMTSLRNKYKVVINKKVLKRVKRELNP